jgi:hypothetical protein
METARQAKAELVGCEDVACIEVHGAAIVAELAEIARDSSDFVARSRRLDAILAEQGF